MRDLFGYVVLILVPIVWQPVSAAGETGAPAVLVVCAESGAVAVRTLATSLVYPWSVAFLYDGSMLVTERVGNLRRISPTGHVSPPVAGLPPVINLLDVVVEDSSNSHAEIFLSFVGLSKGRAQLEVVKGVLIQARLSQIQTVFLGDPRSDLIPLTGGRMVLVEGALLLSTGDVAGVDSKAQDPGSPYGKILRITARAPWHSRIESLGHRNIQGFGVDAKTTRLWAVEHGPLGGDELNLIRAQRNYGWPLVSFGSHYTGEAIPRSLPNRLFEEPVATWSPAIAPSGLAIYHGTKLSGWDGSIFIGSLVQRHLRRLEISRQGRVLHEEVLLSDLRERIRDVRQGPDGFLYVLTDSVHGRLLRIEPTLVNRDEACAELY